MGYDFVSDGLHSVGVLTDGRVVGQHDGTPAVPALQFTPRCRPPTPAAFAVVCSRALDFTYYRTDPSICSGQMLYYISCS